MRATLIILILLSLSTSTKAQSWLDLKERTGLQQAPAIFQVQLLLGAPPDNNPLLLGPVFQIGNPSLIGAWVEGIQSPPIPPPCAYCVRRRASRFRQLITQILGLKAPDGSSVFITLYVTMDGPRITRAGLPISEGQWVLIEDDSNRWEVLSGGGWIVQDDNGEWRLYLTLIESQ